MSIFSSFNEVKLRHMCMKLGDRVKALQKKNKESARQIKVLQNQVAYLTTSVNRWTSKFRDPKYSVPEKIITEMESEFDQFKEKVEAEVIRLRAQKAALVEMVAELEDKEDWTEEPDQPIEMQYEFTTSHVNAAVKESDKKAIEAEIQDYKQLSH